MVQQVNAGQPGAAAGLVHGRTQFAEHVDHVHGRPDRERLALLDGDQDVDLDVAARGAVLRPDLLPVRWRRPQQRAAYPPDQLLLIFP
ncbi:hypothetical protein [Actinocrispum sp. NPDC049592]|uniref:hypothetical protein n=1 Tax=Actinocrispum sp. NPDC049592 TaxID=3154835 RepID=UPI003435B50D